MLGLPRKKIFLCQRRMATEATGFIVVDDTQVMVLMDANSMMGSATTRSARTVVGETRQGPSAELQRHHLLQQQELGHLAGGALLRAR